MRKYLHIGLIIAFITLNIIGATARPLTDSIGCENDITVSLVTFFPGDESFSIYGHSEIRVQEKSKSDLYYNYGVFDFKAPGFVYRFVTGDALYYCVPIPAQFATVGMEGRRMVEQQLNLTPEQAQRVAGFLQNNAKPENRAYQYRYLTDNCSTKPRDIIEMAVDGDTLNYGDAPQVTTYRKMMTHYGKNYAWQQFGIDLVLGSKLDSPIDYRKQMFVPMVLMEAVKQATITRDGSTLPLVSKTDVVIDTDEQGLILPPTPWWCSPLAVTLAVLAIAIIVSLYDIRHDRFMWWFDAMFFGILGMAGCIITFLAVCSHHEALWPNYNLLWAHPLALIAAAASLMHKKAKHVLITYHRCNEAIMALTLLGWYFLPQVANTAFFPIMLTSLIRSTSFIISKKNNRVTAKLCV